MGGEYAKTPMRWKGQLVLGDCVVLGRDTKLGAQVELLRELLEAPREQFALEGIEGKVATASVVLEGRRATVRMG